MPSQCYSNGQGNTGSVGSNIELQPKYSHFATNGMHILHITFHRVNKLNQFEKPLHCAKKPVTTMLTYPWKCAVLHCNHLVNTWKPLVLMTRHFDYCPSSSTSVGSSAPVVSRCFPGNYNVKLYISTGRLAWWLLAFLCHVDSTVLVLYMYLATLMNIV